VDRANEDSITAQNNLDIYAGLTMGGGKSGKTGKNKR